MELMGTKMSIDAPTAEVFDFMADPENEMGWNPDIKSIRRLGSGPIGVGTEWEGVYRGMGKMRVRIEEYDRPRRLAFTTSGPRLDMRFAFDFAPDPSRAELTADAEMRPKGLTKLMTPLFAPMMRRTFSRRPAQMEDAIRRRHSQGGTG